MNRQYRVTQNAKIGGRWRIEGTTLTVDEAEAARYAGQLAPLDYDMTTESVSAGLRESVAPVEQATEDEAETTPEAPKKKKPKAKE